MRGAIPPTAQIKLLLTFKINTIMTKNYYRNEYTEQQWIALINKAIEFGCKITYNIYGNIATIDSTDLETALIKEKSKFY